MYCSPALVGISKVEVVVKSFIFFEMDSLIVSDFASAGEGFFARHSSGRIVHVRKITVFDNVDMLIPVGLVVLLVSAFLISFLAFC